MKRPIALILIAFSLFSLSAFSINDENPLDSPLNSVSYTGRFSDVFSNPAALPLIETDVGPFLVSVSFSDGWDGQSFGSTAMPLLQEQEWNVQASFISRYVSLTASFGSEFERISSSDPLYNVHSSMHLEIDMGYAVPHFSVGARLSGGNKMIRRNQRIDTISNVFANSWFSPFERESGSEAFDVGIGGILTLGPAQAGIYLGKLLTLRNNNIYFGLDALAESMTLSLSLGADRYTNTGDLRFFRPRGSISMTGLVDSGTRSVEAEADMTFQFLPDASLTFAVSYLEKSHELFAFNVDNGYVSFYLRGEGAGFSGTIGFTFKATDFSKFSPAIIFSYIS